MIGATADAIDKAEDRSRFDKAMKSIGLECPRADTAKSMEEAYKVLDMELTLGGTATSCSSLSM